jgi:hypothetical protein
MRLTIVGRNPLAAGSECVIFGHIARRDGAFVPVSAETRGGELAVYGGWDMREMRSGVELGVAPALVGSAEGADYCRTGGRLLLLSHRWSGRLQINNVGRKYVVDLYSEQTRLTLLDIVDEIMIDVAGLAVAHNGGLGLPAVTADVLVRHVAESGAWFRLLDQQADFRPGLLRRMLERFRRQPDDRLKLRLVAALLPAVAAPPAAPPPPPPFDDTGLRDELRLLAAAIEGLALRAPA